MKKKIAFIEPFRHYEVLAALLRLLEDDRYEIHCFCTAFCKAQIPDHKQVLFYTSPKEVLDDSFLNQQINILNNCSYIFFTTIDIHATFFFKTELKAELIGLVHNSHNFFFYKKEKSVDRKRYYLNKLRGDFQRTEKILECLDRVVVPTFFIEKYIRQKTKQPWIQKLTSIEIAVPKEQAVIYEREEIIITIPGTINQDRRDYECLLHIFPKLDQRIDTKVKFYFLGKPFSKRETKLLQQIFESRLQNIDFVVFEDYVDIFVFEKILKETDFLLLPIQHTIKYKAFLEKRGKTCVSGNINDITQFGLPAILPAFYPLAPELESLVARYEGLDDLVQTLVYWIDNRHFNLLKEASDFSNYTLRIKEKLKELFL